MRPLITGLAPLLVQAGADALDSFRTLGKRSILALLGIVIGSASIVAVINIGHNARQDVASIFQDMGVDTLAVQLADKPGVQPSALSADAAKIKGLDLANLLVAAAAITSVQVGFNRRHTDASLAGTEPALIDVMKFSLARGRFLHPLDQGSNVAVLGHEVADRLVRSGSQIRLGDWLRINHYLFRVIGVLQPATPSMISPVFADNTVFVPLQGMVRVAGDARINDLVVRTLPPASSESAARVLGEVLRRTFPTRKVELISPLQMIEGMGRQNRTFHYLLLALGAITLAGGGVAVMNVMYMNVSERRIKIGLRLAIGARRQDIRNLFLIEAATLSTLGAVLGAGLGMAMAYVYARVSGWAFALSLGSMPLGVLSTVVVGVFFGLKPAITASRLTPVEALRDG